MHFAVEADLHGWGNFGFVVFQVFDGGAVVGNDGYSPSVRAVELVIYQACYPGDILVIDKSLEARDGDMAVCFLDGEFTLKTIRIKSEEILLEPANPDYPTIHVSADNDFVIWGIVTYCIHKIRR